MKVLACAPNVAPIKPPGAAPTPKKKRARACTGYPSDKSTAHDDHGHLGDYIDQVLDDAGDVEVNETLSQYATSLRFGAVERGPDTIEAANDQRGRRDGFISMRAKMATSVGRDITVKLSPYVIP
ncbi:hypothetical protein IBA8402_33530 [Pseudomonas syringae]